MKLTAELSLYPLHQNYIEIIESFIQAAGEYPHVTVTTNATSTRVSGEYDPVMALISRELRNSFEQFGKQVLVCKLLPGELDSRQG